jgi:hydrogenase maturation protein HypF
MGMRGEVRNIGGLVEIFLTDDEARIEAFLRALRAELPPPAEIVHDRREKLAEVRIFDGFAIRESAEGGAEASVLPADLTVCGDCMTELRDADDARWMHPFISCMSCGPRYSILERVPYDRDNTSMADFPMCAACENEYAAQSDRRYHAQTISCHNCGPMLIWSGNGNGNGKEAAETEEKAAVRIFGELLSLGSGRADADAVRETVFRPLASAISAISRGEVVALKGVGGYYFVCSPFSGDAIRRLRAVKIREEKPFAVLFPDVDAVRAHCAVNPEEAALLQSRARPIVLLERREGIAAPVSPETYRSSRYMGAFLPSMALQYMLLEQLGPLIMTSANLSDMPILKDDEEMLRETERQPLIAGVLYNARRIRTRLDDSVTRVADGRPQMIRRAKGYTPAPIFVDGMDGLTADDMVFAAGGHLKSAFTLTKGNLAYVSQHFGDLDTQEAETVYMEGLRHMQTLLRVSPGLTVCDLHPLYATTRIAEEYGRGRKTEHAGTVLSHHRSPEDAGRQDAAGAVSPGRGGLLRVQHHHAHVASVMAEHGLSGPVIGVSFDGTGYGTDGKIWGGEFLLCEGGGFQRMAHLKYVRMAGGDSAVKEAWKSAAAYAYDAANGAPAQASATRRRVMPALRRCRTLPKIHKSKEAGGRFSRPEILSVDISDIIAYSNSMGTRPNRKELEAALAAGVNVAESSSMGRLFDAVASFLGIRQVSRYEGECAILLENAAAGAMAHPGRSRAGDLALKFHMDVAALVGDTCGKIREKTGVGQVALTGGVFQNKILFEESLRLLRDGGFSAYYNISVPPNDGGISLGQAYVGMCSLRAAKTRKTKV